MAWMKPAGADVPSCCHGDAETINVKGGKQFSRNWTRETRTVRRDEWWEAEFCAELHILCVKKKITSYHDASCRAFPVSFSFFLSSVIGQPPWWKPTGRNGCKSPLCSRGCFSRSFALPPQIGPVRFCDFNSKSNVPSRANSLVSSSSPSHTSGLAHSSEAEEGWLWQHVLKNVTELLFLGRSTCWRLAGFWICFCGSVATSSDGAIWSFCFRMHY